MTNALAPRVPTMATGALEDPERLGTLLAASGYFSDTRDAAQAVVKVLAGAELGFGPIASMTGINIIKGRVTMSAFLMAATVKRHPKYNYRVKEHTNQRAAIEFFEDGKSVGVSEFTADDAQTARLTGENWQKYRGNMLFWRAMSNGAKFFCPDAFAGAPVYTPDELGAEVDDLGDLAGGPIASSAPASEPAPPARSMDREDVSAVARASAPPRQRSTADILADNDIALRGGGNGKGGASPATPPAQADDRTPSASAPSDPPTGPVTADEAAAFMEVARSNAIPENLWRVALVTGEVDRLEDLSREAFDALVNRVHDRIAGSSR